MVFPRDQFLVSQLGWGHLAERSWTEAVARGLPQQLADLSRDLGQYRERPIRLFTLPTLEAGIEGLGVPFVADDGILLDPSTLDRPADLGAVIARELAHLLYPGWALIGTADADRADYDEMHAFADLLSPRLLRWLPSTVEEVSPVVDDTMTRLRVA